MKLILILLGAAAFILLPVLAFGQSSGQSVIDKKNVGAGFTREAFTLSNGQLVGRTSAGTLSGITLGSGLTLTGTTLTAAGSSSIALDDITDVTIATATTGQLLRYNGTAWVNYTHDFLTATTAASTYQPLNAALTAWNDTATTAFGRGLLAAADAAEFNLSLGLGTVDAVEFGSLVVNGTVSATSYTGSGADLTDLPLDLTGGNVTGPLPLAKGGTGAALTDPNADRIAFWDDSAGTMTWLEAGSGLTITGTTITASGGVATGDSPTWTGAHTFSRNGAVSAPTLSITGTVYSGGTATTTKPLVLIQPSGATSTGWSTSGTLLGVNAAAGFAGRLLDLQVNGVTKFNIDASGNMTSVGTVNTSSYFFTSDAIYAGGAFGASQIYASSLGVTLGSSCYVAFTTGTAIGGTKDLYLYRSAAAILGLHDGTNGASLELREQTAPSSPASNRARIYIEDNGSGKTRLMIKFPTGAAQQISIEP